MFTQTHNSISQTTGQNASRPRLIWGGSPAASCPRLIWGGSPASSRARLVWGG
jgi:hypothetical protein